MLLDGCLDVSGWQKSMLTFLVDVADIGHFMATETAATFCKRLATLIRNAFINVALARDAIVEAARPDA